MSNISSNLNSEIECYLMLISADKLDYHFSGRIIELAPWVATIKRNKKGALPLYVWPFAFLTIILNMYRFYNRNDIDVTISFLPLSNLINTIVPGSKRKILCSRNYESINNRSIFGRICLLSHRSSHTTIAVSKMVRKDLLDSFGVKPDNVKVVYNSLELSEIEEAAIEPIEDQFQHLFNSEVIITVGRLVDNKGFNHLINAFSIVKGNLNNVKLIIMGQGPLEEELNRQIDDLGLTDDVKIIGFQKNPFKFLSKASVYVSTSKVEGFSNALLEAMACGLPVIATDCYSGPRELLAPNSDFAKQTNVIEFAEFGVLTPIISVEMEDRCIVQERERMLAETIITLLSSNTLRCDYAYKANQRANDFDIKKTILLWEKIIMNQLE